MSVFTNKPYHIPELLEATKMTKYFKKSYKSNKSHIANDDNNYANLGPTGTICTLKFPKKFQQQFNIVRNLLQPVILGLDFSHDHSIGIDCFSYNQLHLHQGPKSIVISDPAPFPLHINHISTLPLPPPRTIAIVPTIYNGVPRPKCHYNFIEPSVPYESQQHLFVVHVLKLLVKNYQYAYCVQL